MTSVHLRRACLLCVPAIAALSGSVFSASAATVKITDADCNCTTMTDVPCCAEWGLAAGSECEDDCVLALAAVTNISFSAVRAALSDESGYPMGEIVSAAGVYEFTGLPTGNYRVSMFNIAANRPIGAFMVLNTQSISFSLVPSACTADTDDGSGTGTRDGGVTIDDLLFYLGVFDAGDRRADVDDGTATGHCDGGVTIDDLLYYLARFDGGC